MSIVKSSAPVAITSATGASVLVPLVAGKAIYLCGFTTTGAAATSLLFEYGTGSTCGTGTTALTGAFLPTAGTVFKLSDNISAIKTPIGNALCMVAGGTAGSLQGVFFYLQQ